MLSLKYLRIRKERPAEQCLSTIWREACADFGIPCVLIYLEGQCAYISASLRHLPSPPFQEAQLHIMQEKLRHTQLLFAETSKGYWKHSDYYHTFDCIPHASAKEAAAAIFAVLSDYLHQSQLPENTVAGAASQPAAEGAPA